MFHDFTLNIGLSDGVGGSFGWRIDTLFILFLLVRELRGRFAWVCRCLLSVFPRFTSQVWTRLKEVYRRFLR
jgi:hypothetical protein